MLNYLVIPLEGTDSWKIHKTLVRTIGSAVWRFEEADQPLALLGSHKALTHNSC